MRLNPSRPVASLALVSVLLGSFTFPPTSFAKVYLYAINSDGDLIKYDSDGDQVAIVVPNVDLRYINRRNGDRDHFLPNRVLDVARGKIVSFINQEPNLALLDYRTHSVTELDVGLKGTESWLSHFVYLRQVAKFYIHWLRRQSLADPPEPVLTAVDLSGQILGTVPSPIALVRGASLPHPDGRTFYTLNQPYTLLRVDGENLAILERHDLTPFYGLGSIGQGVSDIQEGRVLLVEGEGRRQDLLDPSVLSTVDLVTRTASPRIVIGLGAADARLIPGGRTIVLQEAWKANTQAGAGRLHFYDVSTGNKLGMVSFRADEGAVPLGFHPDGRRLFLQAFNLDPSSGARHTNLVVVDVVNRTVFRERPFDRIGFAVDFVDEP
jgi:hypothetical protein